MQRSHDTSPATMLTAIDHPLFSGPVHVRVDGADGAPVLVLLHGFCGSMHWFDGLVSLLCDSFRLVRVDLLGHGGTGGRGVDAPAQARMVDAVLAVLGVEAATAIGHSFGADVAVEIAEHSERIDRLVVVAQAPDYSDATLPRGSAIMAVAPVGTVLHRAARPLARVVSVIAVRRNPAARTLTTRAMSDFRALDTRMYRIVLVDRRDRMARRPLDAQVRAAAKPTLVILGGRDGFYGARSAGRYERAGARVEILPESGHSPIVEFPDETAALIRAFLDAG